MKLKHCVTALLLVVVINAVPAIAHAQDDGGFGDPDDPPPTDVPFDGGVGILVAAGVAYGLKKKYDSNKQNTRQ